MQLSFEDRTYLVTGGGSGIGKRVAAGLVAAGASVMIVGRNPDRLAEAVKEIESREGSGGAVRYEPADITHEDEATRAVDAVTAWHGRLHGVVHCAGGSFVGISSIAASNTHRWFGGLMLRRGPDFSAMLEPVFGADGLRGVV